MKGYFLALDPELLNKFKSECALKGISMRSVIIEAIKQFVNKEGKKNE